MLWVGVKWQQQWEQELDWNIENKNKIQRRWGIANGKKLSLKMKGQIYQSCVKSAMLYESETWRLQHNEMVILKRTQTALIRAMC